MRGTMVSRIILVVILCTLGADVATADGHSSWCFDRPDDCARTMKDLMLDEDTFWFGSDFVKRCAGFTTFDNTCLFSTDPVNPSVLRRLYNVSGAAGALQIQQATSRLTLADVRFPPVEGSYYGCGHTYHVKSDGFRLDPTKMTTESSWILDHTPAITWASEQGALYTVLVWDVGSFFPHGLYINARDGSLDGAMTLSEYTGPQNTQPRPNVFMFGVFQQTTTLDPGMVGGVWGKLLGANQGMLHVADFLSDLNGMIAELVAANMMYVPGDAHSMERQKNNYIINSCPLLITQSPALKSILMAANIKAEWSEEKKVLDYTQPSHLNTLTTDLTVEYSNQKDLVVDSCCVKTTFTQGLYRPDPIGTHVTRPAIVRSTPRVNISPISIISDLYNSIRSQTYTLMMVDMSDPSNLIIHWMVTDIKDADVTKGHEVLPYFGPNPFSSNAPRTYVFFLLQQPTEELDTSSLPNYASDNCPDFIRNRCGAQLSRMLEDWSLEKIVGITWLQAVQDSFARKRLYSELMVKTMIDVCDGQPGFEDPCPRDQYCSSTNSGNIPVVNTLQAVLVSALVALYHIISTVA